MRSLFFTALFIGLLALALGRRLTVPEPAPGTAAGRVMPIVRRIINPFQPPDSTKPIHTWTIDGSYAGPNQEALGQLTARLPLLMNLAFIDVAQRMGIEREGGFRYPLTIRFVDELPSGAEQRWAYVKLTSDLSGTRQDLYANLEAYRRGSGYFDKAYLHEMGHVFLAEAIGPRAFSVLPVWFVEGMAMWSAEEGKPAVKAHILARLERFETGAELLGPLEGERQMTRYPQYYMAIEYISQAKGPEALRQIIEDLAGGTELKEALRNRLGEDWNVFKENVRRFSADYLRKVRAEIAV